MVEMVYLSAAAYKVNVLTFIISQMLYGYFLWFKINQLR